MSKTMSKQDVLGWIQRTRVVPVVRAGSAEEALQAVEALLEGGIDVLEITMTVPGAVEVVREIAALHGERALVGAGTVLDARTAEACVEAGARFVVSPALDEPTVKACRAKATRASQAAVSGAARRRPGLRSARSITDSASKSGRRGASRRSANATAARRSMPGSPC